ncbi:MAG: DNA polymerase III subunit gamma/tau [Planctomycetota bacterium]|jgi:DNA polymerase-3 subunit gamma/tau
MAAPKKSSGKKATKAAAGEPAAAYVVFARKYRPATFAEMVGQEVVARTLADAVQADRVAHAYLFAGPRGVGKTSIARILAKSLNCEQGPTVEPCGRCDCCRGIIEGGDVDVAEIDGASNRGIEEIRAIRDNSRYLPTRARYRIYLVDEVHMLTREAFNALLKTLEEPPPHVKFLFATTAPERVPETVRSRCQRFDFRRIPDPDIAEHLAAILKQEKRSAEPAALQAIARKADGGLRDALSLLDQAFAGGAKTLTAAELPRLLGWTPVDELEGALQELASGDGTATLERVERLYADGRDPAEFCAELLSLVRDVIVTEAAGPQLARVPGADGARLAALAEQAGRQRWLATAQILAEARRRMEGGGGDARLHLELALLSACRLGELAPLGEVVARLQAMSSGAAPPAAAAPAPSAPARPAPAPPAPRAPAPAPPERPPPPPPAKGARTPIRMPPSSSPKRTRQPAEADASAPAQAGDAKLESAWEQMLEGGIESPELFGYLHDGRPLKLEGGRLTVGLPKGHTFQKKQLEGNRFREELDRLIAGAFGAGTRASWVLDAAVQPRKRAAPEAAAPAPEAEGVDPAVARVLRTFEGKLTDPNELER